MATRFDLENMAVLITGAGRGLGRALAIAAADAGATVAALDIDAALLEEMRGAAGPLAGRITPFTVDVTDRNAFLSSAATFAQQAGRIDAVVNNAMLIRYDPIERVDEAIIDRMVAIGIKGGIWGVQALLAHYDPARGGAIVNMASPVAERGFAGTCVYSMVKGALGTLTRTLAAELGPRGIRVNAVAPGSIPTPGAVAITPREEYERRGGSIPLRRLGRDEDNAMAVLYLLSDAAGFVNGEILHVDGGILASA